MSGHQHCINCLQESDILYQYPCVACGWSPEQHSTSGLYLSPGTILHGQYQIARMLGHGGFGITYLAWDNLLEIKLAIKEYMPRDFATRNASNSEISTFAGDAKENFTYGLERFLDEARTLAKFQQHSGIVSVLNVFYGNSTGYMVMEYVDGLTLKEYLVDKDKLSWEQTLQLFMPVMDALRAVHKSGMLHRDISPDNIYLCQDNRVKLLDFGSARFALGGHSRSLSVVVKPGYAPEEQYRTKGKQGSWTDVYSVAASMYRCITGLVPPDALDRLDEDELKKPSVLGVKIPQGAEKEILAALAIKAENRTQTIESLQNGLLAHSNVEPELIVVKPQAKSKHQVILEPVTIAPKAHKVGANKKSSSIFAGILIWGVLALILYSNTQKNDGDFVETQQKMQGKSEIGQNNIENIQPDKSSPESDPLSIKEELNKQIEDKSLQLEPIVNTNKTENIEEDKANLTPTSLLALKDLFGVTGSDEQVRTANDKLSSVWFDKLLTIGSDQIHVFFTKSQPVNVKTGEVKEYHLADVTIGVITYQLIDDKWQVISKDPKFTEFLASYGDVPKDKLPEFIKLKNNKPVFKIYSNQGGQGVITNYETLFIFSKNKWVNQTFVISDNNHSICSDDSDPNGPPPCFGYEGQLEIIEANKEFPDLILKRQGNESDEDKMPVKDITYVFNGKKYVELVEKKFNETESLFDAQAQIKLANEFYSKKNYKEAIDLYRKAADQGNIAGEYNLGIMYEKGLGVKKDVIQAITWYQKGANQKDKDSLRNLINAQIKLAGQLYQDKNFKDSVLWYRKVADLGSAVGQYNLGILYEKGLGVAKDDNQAHSWFQKAADQGDADAIKKLKSPDSNKESLQENNQNITNNPPSKVSYAIGDKLSDGSIVFFVDSSGFTGLASKMQDTLVDDWDDLDDAMKLISSQGRRWRLPTIQELNLLFKQKNVVGGFVDKYYWSSTMWGTRYVTCLSFPEGGSEQPCEKYAGHSVRAIRAF